QYPQKKTRFSGAQQQTPWIESWFASQPNVTTILSVYQGANRRRTTRLAGVVTLSQTERNLPTTANVDARNFKDLARWLIVQIGPISLNVTTP
ncbi:MAG: hypothetical protein MUO37_12080, partial [Methyloceanibacter sp.]|nr:hypothetical protein [Methyloceanibacter sp.]